jgi:hypothetical protein
MRPATWLVFVFVVALCAGAAPVPRQGAPRGTDYFPLAKGTKWVYKCGDNQVAVVVTDVERVDGENWIRVETLVGKNPVTVEYYAVRDDGVYRTKVKEDKLDPPVKVLPSLIKVGETWDVNSELGGQTFKGTMTLKGDREKVKTPAGEFETVLVESANLTIAGTETTVRMWFARDYGMVKAEFVIAGGEPVLLELAKFSPVEAAPPPRRRPAPRRRSNPRGLSRRRAVYYPLDVSSFQ